MKHLLLLLFCLPVFSQSNIVYNDEIINALDADNKKTGVWKVFDQKNNVVAICEFKDDIAISPMKYYKDSKLFVIFDKEYTIVYKDNDSIQAKYHYNKETKTLIDEDGNAIDPELRKSIGNIVQIQPQYYGGLAVLFEYIKNNIDDKNTKRKKGKVNVRFTLDRNGAVASSEIISSTESLLNEEALRVINSMPRWQPGIQNGTFVRVQYNLPLTFN